MRTFRYAFLVAVAVLLFVIPGHIEANQGRFSLVRNSVDCEGISVWLDGRYQITGTCGGLVYPYAGQLDRYSLWVQPDAGGQPVWITDIDRGGINTSFDRPFTELFVTAESDSTPRQPGTVRIVSGSLNRFDFPVPYRGEQVPEQTESTGTAPVETPSPTPISAASSAPLNIGSIQAFPLVLIGILLLVIVGVLYAFRH